MNVWSGLRAAMHVLDRHVATAAVRHRRERPALLGFLFHGVFEDNREATSGDVVPFQPVTTSDLREIVDTFSTHGYRFVTPQQIAAGLDPNGLYAWLTFDDGYANNLRTVEILREYGVPATFFVATNYVIQGRAFWWDALYRHRRRAGATLQAIAAESLRLLRTPLAERETFLHQEFGPDGQRPVGDTDRPLTVAELQELAREPLVTIGNHTADHVALPILSDDDAQAQMRACQSALAEIIGTPAEVIAYPYGFYDARVARLARAEGLRVGAIVVPRRNQIPLNGDGAMTIARYLLGGHAQPLGDECLACRSDLQVLNALRRLRFWWMES